MCALPPTPRYPGRRSFHRGIATDPRLNRFLHEISPRVEDQVGWLERYFLRPDDYYFYGRGCEFGRTSGRDRNS